MNEITSNVDIIGHGEDEYGNLLVEVICPHCKDSIWVGGWGERRCTCGRRAYGHLEVTFSEPGEE